jgi:hypothetical protein
MLNVKKFIREEEKINGKVHVGICVDSERGEYEAKFNDSEKALIEHFNNNLRHKLTYDQLRDLVNLIEDYGQDKYEQGASVSS